MDKHGLFPDTDMKANRNISDQLFDPLTLSSKSKATAHTHIANIRAFKVMSELPTNSNAELAAALVKGAVSSIPFLGGVIAEVGNLYLNPLEQRRQRWVTEVSKAISEIEAKLALVPSELQGNEKFISFLYQATFIAMKNHQQAKIDALRNAVVSSAKREGPSEDLKFQFLRYIDDLSATHVSILACLDKYAGEFEGMENLEQVYKKLQERMGSSLERNAFRSFLQDLVSSSLVHLGDTDDLPEYESQQSMLLLERATKRQMKVTPLGRQFLNYICATSPQ